MIAEMKGIFELSAVLPKLRKLKIHLTNAYIFKEHSM